MIYIHAPAQHIARVAAEQMRLRSSEWTFVGSAMYFRGRRNSSIVMVDDPRYLMNWKEEETLAELTELIAVQENEVVEWIL